jgi:hypothetical protein
MSSAAVIVIGNMQAVMGTTMISAIVFAVVFIAVGVLAFRNWPRIRAWLDERLP